MRIHHFLMIAGLSVAVAVPARAQSLQKVGSEVHHALKTAGNDVKTAAGEVAGSTHQTLKKAGNDTKAEAAKVTGVHRVGGDVGKVANNVSRSGKQVGRTAKHDLKKTSATAHHSLKKSGNKAKAKADSVVKR